MAAQLRVGVLASGGGTNLQALLDSVHGEEALVVAVASDRHDAHALRRARDAGVDTGVFALADYPDRATRDRAIADWLTEHDVELVVLAGYMALLTSPLLERFAGRVVNIHPSLLPAFPGLHTHERALAAGVKVHGCTVHFVTPELDHGPIVAQAAVPVRAGDDAAALAARVLKQEHIVYPRAVRWFLEGKLALGNGVVHIKGNDAQVVLAAD
jgi:phosphoribosylglycinamide formyltransferase 1